MEELNWLVEITYFDEGCKKFYIKDRYEKMTLSQVMGFCLQRYSHLDMLKVQILGEYNG